jgi:hypothetical protein
MAKVKALPFVEENEVSEAESLIDKMFLDMPNGKPFELRPAGYMIATKIYVRPDELMVIDMPDGSKKTLWTPEVSKTHDKFDSVSALVCAVEPQAYKGFNPDGTSRYPEGPWCRVGDWIVIPRQSAFICHYHGAAMAIIPDDKVIAVIKDPTDVSSVYMAPKV